MLKQIITLLSVAAMLLCLLPASQAQTVSIPLGSLNVTATPPAPPPPPAFTQQVSQVVNTTVTINGTQYSAKGTLAGTITFTPVVTTGGSSGTGTTAGPTTISGVIDGSGVAINAANGGATVTVAGSNFGAGGSVTFAGLPTLVVGWTPTAISVVLPKPASSGLTPVGPIVVTPTGGTPVTSGFSFTITLTTTGGVGAPAPTTIIGTSPMTGIIEGYKNLNGQWIQEATEGDTVVMIGTAFGTAKGFVVMNTVVPATVTNWTDTALTIVVPRIAPQAEIPEVRVASPQALLVAWTSNGGILVHPKA